MRHDVITGFDRQRTPAAALALWDAAPGSLQPVRESENFVYRFRDLSGRERYLRIGHALKRPLPAVRAELDFVTYLHQQRADVAPPIPSRAGNLVEPLEANVGPMHAVVFEAARGEQVKWGTDAQNRAHLFERGQALGRLHRLSQGFVPSPQHRRSHWFEDDLFLDPLKYLPPTEPAGQREYDELFHYLSQRPRTADNYGMVHGDFGTFNTLRVGKGRLVAFDFDDCSFHWRLYDLAVAIRSARKLPDQYRKPYVRVLMEGYATQMSLNGDTPQDLSMFARLAALYRFVAVLRSVGPDGMTPEQRQLLDERREVLAHPPAWC